jgi:hypothetical protein
MEKTDSELIDALGGTCEVAALCGITPEAVSQWRRNGMPKAWRKYLALLKPRIAGKPKKQRSTPIASSV